MERWNLLKGMIIGLLLVTLGHKGIGQLSITGQLRPRSEIRNGTGTLKPTGNQAAFFVSQRARLTFNYRSNKVIFQTAVQDVRVWGQDASSISNADGSRLSVHEAWADVILTNKKDSSFRLSAMDYFSVKIGRQELLYDDSRLLGNLDWLQQGRRHDAIVFKMLDNGWQVDLGGAFNQNTDAFNYNGTYYTPANVNPYVKDSKGNLVPTPPNMVPLTNGSGYSAKNGSPSLQNMPGTNGLNQNYKALQFLYAAKYFKKTKISGLVVVDEFAKYKLDSVRTIAGSDTGYVFGRRYNQNGVNTRFTGGLLINSPIGKKNWSVAAGAYYQFGSDKEAYELSAFTTTLSLSFTAKKFIYTAGWDYLSGNDAFSTSQTNHRFDPLYGTPHKFWGYMDYFYAGTGSPSGGLSNPFLRVKYISNNKLFTLGLDYHYFAFANAQKDESGNKLDNYLGSEFDFLTSYNINKITNLEVGLCYLVATSSMEYAKNIPPGTAQKNASWAYLQLNVKPEFLSK